jgi:hypothetical protein
VLVIPLEARQPASELSPDPGATSPLGNKLLAIRAQIVASGVQLLDWGGVDAEKAKLRNDR